jgi:serine/threonine-protein kinase
MESAAERKRDEGQEPETPQTLATRRLLAPPREAPTLPATPDARHGELTPIPTSSKVRPSRTLRVPEPHVASVTGAAALRAMHSEEAARARAMGRALFLMAIWGFVVDPFITSTPVWLRVLTCTTLLVVGGVSAWVWWVARDENRYTRRVFRVFAASAVVAQFVVVYHAGVFSPMPLLATLGISFFGLGHDDRFAKGASVAAALSYVVLASLVTLEVVPDYGLFRASSAALEPKLFMIALVPAVLMLTLWQARVGRKAVIEAIRRSNEAIRLARQREAELQEVKVDLDVALRAVAGHEGRYTGSRVGPYVLAEVVGRGAMGEVYAASHFESGRRAAVKLLQASVADNHDMVQRFLREGEVARRLCVPNVVEVFEVGEAQDGAPYIAMELLQGKDLSAHLRDRRQLTLEEAATLCEHVAAGLEAAHEAGIVHRDLKPQNIFLAEDTPRPVWKILDFGVSKLRDSSGTLTRNAVIGTPGYMSPEQAQGRETDPRSDIFSLGAVVYRALTGRPPFGGGDMPQILFEIVYRTPSRPSELCPELPPEVDLVLSIALAKRPEDRFAGARELGAALRAASRGELSDPVRERGLVMVARYPWGRAVLEPRRPAESAARLSVV